jgi:hypothetical protein
MTGLSCLLSGWFSYPLGWLANPTLLAGVLLLTTRRRLAACLGGTLALGMASLWTYKFRRDFRPEADLLREGYNWWLGGMVILAGGSFGSIAAQYGAGLVRRSEAVIAGGASDERR